MGGPGFFSFFLDLMFLMPILLFLRAISPSPLVFRIASILAGIYLLYGQAPRLVFFVFGYWCVVWALQSFAVWSEKIRMRFASVATLTLLVVIPLAPMVIWKLAPDTVVPWFNQAMARLLWATTPGLGFADALVAIAVPLGLSFATFRAIDLLLKVHLGLLQPLSIDRVLYYGLFPPILALGPISEYEEVRLDKRLPRFPAASDLAVGLFRLMLGVIKIFLIGTLLNRGAAMLWQGGAGSVFASWGALLVYGAFFYINFDGFSEVAIGLSRILGIKLKENFANPFFQTNPQAFWNAWHMSLTRWALRYIFVPLGGMRQRHQYLAIFASIMVIAMWHDIALPLVVFGVFHGAIVVAHRYLLEGRRRVGKPAITETWYSHALKSLAVFVYVSFSIPLLILNGKDAIALYSHLLLGTHV